MPEPAVVSPPSYQGWLIFKPELKLTKALDLPRSRFFLKGLISFWFGIELLSLYPKRHKRPQHNVLIFFKVLPSVFFYFSWYSVRLQFINFTMVNGDRKQKEGRVCTILLHVIIKSPTPVENKLTAILTRKRPCLARDLNPASLDRMALFYLLCRHHCSLNL